MISLNPPSYSQHYPEANKEDKSNVAISAILAFPSHTTDAAGTQFGG